MNGPQPVMEAFQHLTIPTVEEATSVNHLRQWTPNPSVLISSKARPYSQYRLPISCLLRNCMTAWYLAVALEGFPLRRALLAYIALALSFQTPGFDTRG